MYEERVSSQKLSVYSYVGKTVRERFPAITTSEGKWDRCTEFAAHLTAQVLGKSLHQSYTFTEL